MDSQTIKLSSLKETEKNELLFSSAKKQNKEYFRVIDYNDGKTVAERNKKPKIFSEEMRKSQEYEVNKILNSNKSPQKIVFRLESKTENSPNKNSYYQEDNENVQKSKSHAANKIPKPGNNLNSSSKYESPVSKKTRNAFVNDKNSNASISNNLSNSSSFYNQLLLKNSKEEHEFIKNLGIRDFLRYINRKNNLKQSSPMYAGVSNLNNQESYRSKSAHIENKKELLTQSVRNKIENSDAEPIEKARGDIRNQFKIKLNTKNDIYFNNKRKIEYNHYKNTANKEENKDDFFFEAQNDIFSDDDYKFIEMSKSQKRKFRRSREQRLSSSVLSNETDVNPTAHFNLTKSANVDLNKNHFNLNNAAEQKIEANLYSNNIQEENKENMFLKFYVDEFNKLPNKMSNKNMNNFNHKNSYNVFQQNLYNREDTLSKKTRSAKINKASENSELVNNEGKAKFKFNEEKVNQLTGDTELDRIEGLVKSRGRSVENIETHNSGKAHIDSNPKTNSNYTDTFQEEHKNIFLEHSLICNVVVNSYNKEILNYQIKNGNSQSGLVAKLSSILQFFSLVDKFNEILFLFYDKFGEIYKNALMNIDNKILEDVEVNNSFAKKKPKLEKKLYELIINDIDSLIALCRNYLEKYESKRKDSILNATEAHNKLENFKKEETQDNTKLPSGNKKVKFLLEAKEAENNSLAYLNHKFQLFKEEMNAIQTLMKKKMENES